MDSLYHSPFVFASVQDESCIILDIHTEHPADILRFWGNVSIMPVHLFSTYGRIIPICEFRLLHYFPRKELFCHGRALHGNDRLAEHPPWLSLWESCHAIGVTERGNALRKPSPSRRSAGPPLPKGEAWVLRASALNDHLSALPRCDRIVASEKKKKGSSQKRSTDYNRF